MIQLSPELLIVMSMSSRGQILRRFEGRLARVQLKMYGKVCLLRKYFIHNGKTASSINLQNFRPEEK